MSEFGQLLAKAKSLGISYKVDEQRKEIFVIAYKDREWTRDTPKAIRGLLYSVIRAVENGRL